MNLKSDSHLPRLILFICFNDSSLKMMKNVFYFIFKALFVLKIFNFCLDFLVMWKKQLHEENKVNFNIFDVKTVTIYILPNISRSKGNQTLKFGQVI